MCILMDAYGNDYLWVLKSTRIDMKYYSQYHNHELFELQESLSGLR